ncbi:MAG: hypothetical protein KGL36_05540 [Gammaproteobacteria bacterium]|nr:hypothetical protein [Gammaproteobacteria bacterium]
MADTHDTLERWTGGGVTAERDRAIRVASLRYFDPMRGEARVAPVLGCALPAAGRLERQRLPGGADPFALLWRSPSETWVLAGTPAPIDALRRGLGPNEEISLVDQSGGIAGIHLAGARALAVLQRLGSSRSIPRVGEARTGRFADVVVTVAGWQADEYLLLVERAYCAHLLDWIRETLADL